MFFGVTYNTSGSRHYDLRIQKQDIYFCTLMHTYIGVCNRLIENIQIDADIFTRCTLVGKITQHKPSKGNNIAQIKNS